MALKKFSVEQFRTALQSEYLQGGHADMRAQNLSDEDLLKENLWTDLQMDSMDFAALIVSLERFNGKFFRNDGKAFGFFEKHKNRKKSTVRAFLDFAETQMD